MSGKPRDPGSRGEGGESPANTHSEHWLEVACITLIGTLVIGGYTLGSLNRDAFFLMKFEVEQLPFMLVAVALVGVPFLSIYAKIATLFPTGHLASGYFLIVGIGYFVMSRLVLIDTQWSVLVFYFYVTLAGVLSISIFWLAVGARFYMRQAKKMMSLFGAGCVCGNLLGGAIGRWGSHYVETETLIAIVGQMFLFATLLSLWVFRPTQMRQTSETEEKGGYLSGFKELRQTPLLRAIAIMLMGGVMIGTLADYQLQAMAKEEYPSKVELVQFFGTLYAILGAVTLLAQLMLTNWILKKFGMFGGLMSLPLAALPGGVAMIAVPSIFSAVLLRGAENGIRFSIYSSGYELAYLPVDEQKRKRAKPLIDVLLKRGATGLAALLILFLTEVAEVGQHGISIATMTLVVIMTGLVWNVRKIYVAALQMNLSDSQDDPFEDGMQTTVHMASNNAFHHEQTGAWTTSIIFSPEFQDAATQVSQSREMASADATIPLLKGPSADASAGALFENLQEKKNLTGTLAQIYRGNDPRYAAALLPFLGEEHSKKMVIKIFNRFGTSVVGVLADAALNEQEPLGVRKAAILQLGRAYSPLTIAVLKILFRSPDKHIRRACSSAFLAIRKKHKEQKLSVDELIVLLERESSDDHVIWHAQAELKNRRADEKNSERLQQELIASQDRRRRHLFRLLSLCYDLKTLNASFNALTGDNGQARDTALEYLDNVLHERVKNLVWALIDPEALYRKNAAKRSTDSVVQDLHDVGATAIAQLPVFSDDMVTDDGGVFQSLEREDEH